MFELSPGPVPALTRWFPAGAPGPATVGEHVLATGIGSWWADRAVQPRVVAVSCAGHVVLRGTPDSLAPEELAPLAGNRIDAPDRFLPVLGAAFERLTPWERMIWTRQAEPQQAGVPFGLVLRRLERSDAGALQALGPDAAWLSASWGGPLGLASSGYGWAVLSRRGRMLAVACTYFRGSRYEDVAVYTVPDHRRHRLALACVNALCEDIAARGRVPGWNCSVLNRAGRLLAWNAGFRLVREYVHYAAGSPVPRAGGRTEAGPALPLPSGPLTRRTPA
ncbi:GNAT family N-acetyltransferase [Streptomyces sp. 15-116A]|uniref:GNAT family N-acetyltransferase n=1 Tax=Streptomyces sp. 15-116A TaxID=2259035 RepID=UPI0021B3E4C0|nr:GNAT family N-acetyltransferase [Streptomyces sp. 15-116A]MCT7353070.1 GNAT family N-acetyltransferase [Streptomyces sp. 15-116A]